MTFRAVQAAATNPSRIRVGLPVDYFLDDVSADVRAAVLAARDLLSALGAQIVEVELPMTEMIRPVHWALMAAQASAAHDRRLRESGPLYGQDVRVLLEAGAHITAVDYLRAHRVRKLIARSWRELFTGVDVVLTPATPIPAVAHADAGKELRWESGRHESPTDAYVRLASPGNVTGFPAISIPWGTDSEGLPVGVQLLGAPGADLDLLATAELLESTAPGTHPREGRP